MFETKLLTHKELWETAIIPVQPLVGNLKFYKKQFYSKNETIHCAKSVCIQKKHFCCSFLPTYLYKIKLFHSIVFCRKTHLV